MGRGAGNQAGSFGAQARGGVEPTAAGAGEIPLLDADRLDDHADAAVELGGEPASFGDPADDRAIRRLIEGFRRSRSSRGLSDEEIEDRAIDFYNQACDLIRSGRASQEQLEKTARIFGEDAAALKARLVAERDDEGEEEEAPQGGGEVALLGALFGG
jgi:hypothetical protein